GAAIIHFCHFGSYDCLCFPYLRRGSLSAVPCCWLILYLLTRLVSGHQLFFGSSPVVLAADLYLFRHKSSACHCPEKMHGRRKQHMPVPAVLLRLEITWNSYCRQAHYS